MEEEVKPIPSTPQYIGSMRPHKGHIVFEFNKNDKTIVKATIEVLGNRNRIMVKDDCDYTSALNEANAKRKFSKKHNLNLLNPETNE